MPVELTPADIPERMRIERLPGHGAFVGQWTDEGLTGFVMAAPEEEEDNVETMILTRERRAQRKAAT